MLGSTGTSIGCSQEIASGGRGVFALRLRAGRQDGSPWQAANEPRTLRALTANTRIPPSNQDAHTQAIFVSSYLTARGRPCRLIGLAGCAPRSAPGPRLSANLAHARGG